MGGVALNDLSRAEAAGLLAWWLEAGVDAAVAEQPRDWRAKAPAASTGSSGRLPEADRTEMAEPAPSAAPRQLPQAPVRTAREFTSLNAFHNWLAEAADLPLFRAGASRALPHGPAEAEIMLLSGVPAPEDAGEGRPIGGGAWELTKRMLAAIGLRDDQAYVAALTCFSAAGARMSPAETEACRDALLRQIALAAPKRLLLLGDGPARMLLGTPLAAARGKLHRIAGIPAVATFHPRHLLGRPADKALAWRDLLTLMGEPL